MIKMTLLYPAKKSLLTTWKQPLIYSLLTRHTRFPPIFLRCAARVHLLKSTLPMFKFWIFLRKSEESDSPYRRRRRPPGERKRRRRWSARYKGHRLAFAAHLRRSRTYRYLLTHDSAFCRRALLYLLPPAFFITQRS